MAESLPDDGGCMHGVIHVIRPDEAERLDVIEAGYDKRYVKAVSYDGDQLDAFVYCRHDEKIQRGEEHDNLPSERYIQILSEGAAHYGVDQEYVDFLKSQPVEPRTKPIDYERFELPTGDACRVYTRKEIEAADGKDGRELLVTVNGKVLKATCDHTELIARRWIDQNVNYSEPHLAQMLYEPMFGEPPTKLEDFTKAHCDYIEDFMLKLLRKMDNPFACVGRFEQTNKDVSQ